MPATIGMNTASVVQRWIVPSKRRTTDAAMNAVMRLMASHGKRARHEARAGVVTR